MQFIQVSWPPREVGTRVQGVGHCTPETRDEGLDGLLPDEVIARLNREVAAALTHPDVKKRLLDLYIEAKASTPEQLGTLLSSEVKRWGDVITRANIPRQ